MYSTVSYSYYSPTPATGKRVPPTQPTVTRLARPHAQVRKRYDAASRPALAPVRVREGRKVPAMRYVEDHWTSTLITVICLASRTEYRTVQ